MINKKKNNKGFTLVELLVVIAIIGILAVVAVPALFKNINKSKVADLESDYSAIKSAVLSYYTDNNDLPIDLSYLANDMDSVPVKSALGEGMYTFEEGNDAFYLCVGKGELACEEEVHTHEESCISDTRSNYTCGKKEHTHNQDCYTTLNGVTITNEQLEKLVADLGYGIVSVQDVGKNTFTTITEESTISNLVGENKVIRLKLINNTDM